MTAMNKEKALKTLKSKLLAIELEKREKELENIKEAFSFLNSNY